MKSFKPGIAVCSMTVLGNRGLSLSKLIITQLLSICRLVTSSFKRQKQTWLILLTLGYNFRVWSTILKQVKNPQSPCRSEIKIEPRARGPKCAIFPFLLFICLFTYLFMLFIFFSLGGGLNYPSWLQPWKRIEWNTPLPHLPENKDELRISHNMPFIWGRWWELMKRFCVLFCQKTALRNLKTGKDVLRGVPLLDFYGIRLLLSGQTM